MNHELKENIFHIIDVKHISMKFLQELFELIKYKKKNKIRDDLKGKIIAMLFYEPSTRTRFSFEAAAMKLGANIITSENARDFSSASKGETLEDTIKVVGNYADLLVIRHDEDNTLELASKVSTVPIISAGTGCSQHPTQALLDIFTIYEHFGRLTDLKIACVGDLLRSRTVNSLIYLLSQFSNNKFYLISPSNCKIQNQIRETLSNNQITFYETEDLETTLPLIDVLYMTRIQKERFNDLGEYVKAKGQYRITNQNIEKMKENSIVMHPLPRVDEISVDVDQNKRAKYFVQAENGLYVRMALLKMICQNRQ